MLSRLVLLLLLATIPSLAQKLPSAPNASNAKGRQGKWVILFDNKWKETTSADQAEFYRLISYVDDAPAGVVEDHYRNGKLQFNSRLVADRPKNLYDGEATWYYETGSRRITIEFDKGKFIRRVGVWLRNGKPATEDFTALNNRGIELTSEGKSAEAEAAYQVALENVEALYSRRSPTYLVIERNLIDALFAQEKYKEAEKHSQELVTLDLEVLPAEDPAPVDDISYWSTAAQLAGASKEVLGKIDLLGVDEGRKRGKPASYYHMLVSLGTAYKNQDRTAQALPLLEEAWASKKLEGDQTYELLVYSLAGTYSESRRYKESVAVFREAHGVFQRNPENARQAQAMLGYMAIDLQLSGDLKGALAAFRQELEIMKTNGKGESYGAAQTLSNIGIICSELGQLPESEKALLQAEAIFERDALTDVQDRRTLYAAMQTLYGNLGKKDKANAYGKKLLGVGVAAKGTAVDPFNLLATMNDIGYHVDKHNMVTARKKLNDLLRAMESRPNLSQDDQRLYASLLASNGTLRIQELDSMFSSLGATASERIERYDGELRKIEAMFRKGLSIQRADTTVAGKQLQTVTLFQLALVYEKLDVNTDSVVTAVMMNAWRYFPKASKQQIELLAYCASISQLNYSDSKSITDLYRVIFQLLQIYRQQTLPYLSEAGQTGYLKTSRYLLDNFISFAAAESGDNPDIAGFLYDEVLRNKGLILQSLSQTRQLIAEGRDSKLLELFDQWKHLKNQLALASGMDETMRKEKKVNIASLQQQSEDAETRLAAASAEFRKYKIDQPVSWKDIVAKLKPGEAALEIVRSVVTDYDRRDSVYAALVLKPGSKPILIRIPHASTMENRMLKAYRNAIKFKTTPGVPDSYTTYWGELAKGLAGTKKVYFSPDGVFHLISIPSLYNTTTKRYLVDELDVQLVSSTGALLAAQPGNTEWKRGIVLFGSPDFGSARSTKSEPQGRSMSLDNVMPLPGAEKELSDIGKLFEMSGVPFREYVSALATEAQLKSVENPYVLHIATHGYFIPDMSAGRPDIGSVGSTVREDPMLRSGLLLAQCCNRSRGDGTKSEDGVLTAYEASTLSLAKTQLVVLSACDTGLGEVSFGEGVYGLQRAFLESGAASLLMSLWKVDDAATQQLMTDFYREWLKGNPAHEALRAAQQKLRTQFPDPYYWAGFVAVRR